MKTTTVREIMTTRVIWVKKDATFREMAAALREHRVSAFPVVDDDRKVIGVVSEADMLNKEALIDESGVISGILHHRDQVKARGITAGDLMTTAVVAVRPDDTVEHAAKLMYDRAVKLLGHEGVTDVIVLMGYYTCVSLTMNFYAVPAGTPGLAR